MVGFGIAFTAVLGAAWGYFEYTDFDPQSRDVARPASESLASQRAGPAPAPAEPYEPAPAEPYEPASARALPPSTGARAASYGIAREKFISGSASRASDPGDKSFEATIYTASPVVIFDSELPAELDTLLPSSQLLASSSNLPEIGLKLFFYRSLRRAAALRPLELVSVFADEVWLGLFVSESGDSCYWLAADSLWAVTDDFGRHPLLGSVQGAMWTSQEFAQFAGSDDLREINWMGMPARGDAYDRQWKRQLHLDDVPHRDGIVFRYEGGHKYLPRREPGRGNSAHHWNLLAYAIEEAESVIFLENSSPCMQLLARGEFSESWLEAVYDGKD